MGEAKRREENGGARTFNDPRFDKAWTTKGDLKATEANVQGWCDQVRRDVAELLDDAEVKYTQKCGGLVEVSERALRDEIQSLRAAVDEYRVDELRYRNNVSVRGRLRRLKWWLLAVLPFGVGACIGGEPVPNSQLSVSIDSARHVACYQLMKGNAPLSCVRIDSVETWRASDSSWVLR